MSTIYVTDLVLDLLAEAQVVIDLHLISTRLGRCRLCNQVEPCDQRTAAAGLFVRYGRLPRRTPGLTFADASRWSPIAWLEDTADEPVVSG